jgi:hypothetical protein
VVSRADLFLGEAILDITLARTVKEKRKHTTHYACIMKKTGEKKKTNRKNGRYNPQIQNQKWLAATYKTNCGKNKNKLNNHV